MSDEQQQKPPDKRRRYEPPKLEVVKVKLDQVLTIGCKEVFGGSPNCVPGDGCYDAGS